MKLSSIPGIVLVSVALISLGAVPGFLAFLQFLLLPFSNKASHMEETAAYYPNVAVVIPAWDEALSLTASITAMLRQEYPPDRLRVYLVDDASTDQTPQIMRDLVLKYPGQLFYLRRKKGGEGKAAALNYGFEKVLKSNWAQALMIMDADVIFMPDTLRKMTRHLADPIVGAVSCYIREKSTTNHWLSQYIAAEYAIAQAAARRTFNVIGYQPCLAGGSQLHSRENFEAIGGRIDTSTLAEDTYTTLRTQQLGRKVFFDGSTEVWAEEPATISSLWGQRIRWARGNIQISKAFTKTWFRPVPTTTYGKKIFYDLIWFSLLYMPFIATIATAFLIYIYITNPAEAWYLLHFSAYICFICWFYVLFASAAADPATAKRCWRSTLLFPGIVSLVIVTCCTFRPQMGWLVHHLAALLTGNSDWVPTADSMMIFAYIWIAIAMPMTGLAKYLEDRNVKYLPRILVLFCGYGSLLLAAAFTAWFREFRHADRVWHKTVKYGSIEVLP